VIYFYFNLVNPWAREDFQTLRDWHGQVTKNKSWEIQTYKFPERLLSVLIDIEWRGSDHAGPNIELCLFGWVVTMRIYDNRHWNYDTNAWVD